MGSAWPVLLPFGLKQALQTLSRNMCLRRPFLFKRRIANHNKLTGAKSALSEQHIFLPGTFFLGLGEGGFTSDASMPAPVWSRLRRRRRTRRRAGICTAVEAGKQGLYFSSSEACDCTCRGLVALRMRREGGNLFDSTASTSRQISCTRCDLKVYMMRPAIRRESGKCEQCFFYRGKGIGCCL